MLKFKGKPKDFKAYMDNLILLYGRNTPVKEICQFIGG